MVPPLLPRVLGNSVCPRRGEKTLVLLRPVFTSTEIHLPIPSCCSMLSA
ncbi:unnamed protein product [Gulo gulo]|uniref:Uncharacterized protein n=1 Tax=Gulo gulo TaxID=48420 RepID=A0A9X9LSB2_GULGU|nr:unnamed protein product [Gulo gulo]